MACAAAALLGFFNQNNHKLWDINSQYDGSGTLIDGLLSGELDASIVSWGSLLRSSKDKTSNLIAIMLLPRTHFDLLLPRNSKTTCKLSKVFLSTLDSGYPMLLLDELKSHFEIFDSKLELTHSSVAEIVRFLAKMHGAAILAAPYSHIAAKIHGAVVYEPEDGYSRIGDNVLIVKKGVYSKQELQNLRRDIESCWFEMLETPGCIMDQSANLSSPGPFLTSLRRVGSLYGLDI